MIFTDSKWFPLFGYKPNHFTDKAVSCHGTRDKRAERWVRRVRCVEEGRGVTHMFSTLFRGLNISMTLFPHPQESFRYVSTRVEEDR